MRRKKGNAGPNHERWLVSYADFVTMIFALFVVLFASAQADHQRRAEMAQAMQAAFNDMGLFTPETARLSLTSSVAAASRTVPVPQKLADDQFAGSAEQRAALVALKARFETVLAREIRQQTVALRLSHDGLVISLREAGFFESGSAEPQSSSAGTLQTIIAQLGPIPNRLRIEGHTDDVPIHNDKFASNWELSTARASRLARILVEQHGFAPDRLSAAGYAQYHPLAANSDEKGRAMNRRVDVVILPAAAR